MNETVDPDDLWDQMQAEDALAPQAANVPRGTPLIVTRRQRFVYRATGRTARALMAVVVLTALGAGANHAKDVLARPAPETVTLSPTVIMTSAPTPTGPSDDELLALGASRASLQSALAAAAQTLTSSRGKSTTAHRRALSDAIASGKRLTDSEDRTAIDTATAAVQKAQAVVTEDVAAWKPAPTKTATPPPPSKTSTPKATPTKTATPAPTKTSTPKATSTPKPKTSTTRTTVACTSKATVTFTATGGGTVILTVGSRTAKGNGSVSLSVSTSAKATATASAPSWTHVTWSADGVCSS